MVYKWNVQNLRRNEEIKMLSSGCFDPVKVQLSNKLRVLALVLAVEVITVGVSF